MENNVEQATQAMVETIRNRKTSLLRRLKKCIIVRHSVHFHTIGEMCKYSILLPHMDAGSVNSKLWRKLVDEDAKEDLEAAKVLNWCRTLKQLYPLSTRGDGNCLLHAVSMTMWGIHDCGALLRRLVYTALVEDEETGKLKQRWIREKGRQNDGTPQLALKMDSEDWQSDWEKIVVAAEDIKKASTIFHYECLEEIHIFVLANVLKRPIIVLADTVVRTHAGSVVGYNTIHGIYLPILWPATECVKSPIVLGYNQSHFVPLVAMENPPYGIPLAAEHGVALVMQDMTPIPIHFLTESEERHAPELLQKYLKITEVTRTLSDSVQVILTAKLDYTKIDEEYNIMPYYFKALKDQFQATTGSGSRSRSSPRDLDDVLLSDPSLEKEGLQLELQLNGTTEENQLNHRMEETAQTSVPAPQVLNDLSIDPRAKGGTAASNHPPTTPLGMLNLTTEGGDPDRLRQEPSAPRFSLLSNRPISTPTQASETTESSLVTSAHSGLRNSDTYTSAIGIYCRVPDCHFQASRFTSPFCHEHANAATAAIEPAAPPPTHRRAASHDSLSISPTEDTTRLRLNIEENRPRSLEYAGTYETGGSHPCKVPGCRFRGPQSCAGFCQQHYVEGMAKQQQSATRQLTLGTEPQRAENHAEMKMQMQLQAPKCLKEGCGSQGRTDFAGYCSTCYILKTGENDLTVQQVPCKTRGCTFTGTVANGGFCSKCALAECERDARGVDSLTTMELMENLPPLAQAELENAQSFGPCKVEHCQGLATEVLFGYCAYCYKRLFRRQEARNKAKGEARSQARHSAPAFDLTGEPPVFTSTRPIVNMQASPTRTHPGFGLDTRVLTPDPSEKTSYEEELETVKKCWKPGCHKPAYKDYKDLCRECYMAMLSGNERQPSIPPTYQRPAALLTPARPFTAPAASPCKNTYCDRYGDPNLAGYCSRCWRHEHEHGNLDLTQPPRPRSLPPGAATGSEYDRAVKAIEVATKSGLRPCKNPRCRNYGNSRCSGYCNNCYIAYSGVDMLER